MNTEQHGTILLVDDDPDVLQSISRVLIKYEYNVIASSDAEDAIVKLQANSIDIVVTDIIMPRDSGIELLKRVHDIDPQIPVILMTAYADMEKVIDALKMGAFDFIIKPFNVELFIHSVEKAVNYNKMIQMENDYKHMLEEFNQEIETLVSERTMSLMALTLADKIRNPTAVIGLICKRLLDKEQETDELREKLKDIISEVGKLDTIVKDFEELLKIRKSRFKYDDINKHVEGVITINKDFAIHKGVEIHFSTSLHPLRANIESNLFQIALSHLIKNSIEATPEGGKITISTNEDSNIMILTISDTGHGIDKKDIDKIFDPMFSTKDQKFGMGLSLVKQIVTEHLGEIEVESNSGKGATFRIKLPLRWTENQS
jgi:signal transduction histidine kinase